MDADRRTSRARDAVALALLAIAAHHRVLWNGFINLDDPGYVTRNEHVQQGLTGAGAQWAFTTFHAYNWHPLTWLSHMLDVELWGLAPAGHHLGNLLLHALSAALLYVWLARSTGARARSAAVAALFAVHPLHVESVAWVAERKDVLSAALFMLTLCCWAVPGRRPARTLAAVALFAVGLLAKPMLVTVPLVLLLLDFWPLGRAAPAPGQPRAGWRGLLLEKAPFAALAAASCAVTLVAQNSGGRGAIVYESPPALNAGNALISYVRYLGKAAWPADLSIIYSFRSADVTAAKVAAAAALLVAITAIAVALRKSRPYVLFGWLWFLVTLLPVIGFIRIGWHAIADRYTYLPLIGIYVAAVWGAADLAERLRTPRAALLATVAALLAVLAVLTHRQERRWASSVSLFEHALAVDPDNALAHINLGAAYGETRDPRAKQEALLGRLLEARETLALHPGNADAEYRLANAYADVGDHASAIEGFRRTLALRPTFAAAYNNLGVSQAQVGDLQGAARAFEEALRLDPSYADARDNLGVIARMLREAPRGVSP